MVKPCLLVVDFINDLIHEDGKAPSCANYIKEHNVIARANEVIKIARQQSWLILFVKIAFNTGYLELPSHSPVFGSAAAKGAFQLGSWGTDFFGELDYLPTDPVIIKPRVSTFFATPLEAYLNAQSVDTLIITGVSTNNAVQATARDAHDRDYRIVIVKDACGAVNPTIHDNTITLLSFFAKIVDSKSLLEEVVEKSYA